MLVGAALALAASALAEPRPGKVVRIERAPKGPPGTPRICALQNDPAMQGFCIGVAPQPGELITVVDSQRMLGALRITQVTPVDVGCAQLWQFTASLESGDPSQAQGQTWGVIDVPVDPRGGHLIAVDAAPTGHPPQTDQIVAIDANGDGSPDVEFVMFQCDDAGNIGSAATGFNCLDVWQRTGGHHFDRVREDRIKNCFP